MSKMLRGLAILAFAALPGTLVAQGPPAGGPGPMGPRGRGPRNPIATILAQKDTLKLTGDQVAKLQVMQSRLEEKNSPLVKQIEAKRPPRPEGDQAAPPTDEQRQQWRQAMEELRPVMEQIRTNNRESMDAALKLLTTDQQNAVREMMRSRRDGMRGRGMRRRGGSGGAGSRDGGAWRKGGSGGSPIGR